jgi:hypothetical protein
MFVRLRAATTAHWPAWPLGRAGGGGAGRSVAAVFLVRALPGVGPTRLGGALAAARAPRSVRLEDAVADVAAATRPHRAAEQLRRHLVLQEPAAAVAPPVVSTSAAGRCPRATADDDHPAAAAVLALSGGRDGGGGEEHEEEDDGEGQAGCHRARYRFRFCGGQAGRAASS